MIYHCPWCRAICGDETYLVNRHEVSEDDETVIATCDDCGHTFTITLHIEYRLELKRVGA
jgi:DNA-directed RNA polymerase subunit M/transcription elongation factor TFIIS